MLHVWPVDTDVVIIYSSSTDLLILLTTHWPRLTWHVNSFLWSVSMMHELLDFYHRDDIRMC